MRRFNLAVLAALTLSTGLAAVPAQAQAHGSYDGRRPLGLANCTATACHFDVPPGTYDVRVLLGGGAASSTSVTGETRRALLPETPAPAGERVARSFTVNVRTPEGEPTGPDGTAGLDLRLGGAAPALADIKVTPARHARQIFLVGDSTVCDQMGEPWAAWGQMLPRFFKPTVAIANHAESGETVSDSNSRYRFAKILSEIKPGDVFIAQFGHNDMKEKKRDPDAPAKYKAGLIQWIKAVQAKGATAVIVTSMNRHTFKDGKVYNSLEEYPRLAREAAAETGAALIDLNAQSKILYEALGEQGSLALFEHNADGTQRDGTHQSPYGAYELAKIVVQGLRDDHLAVTQQALDDLPAFDPAHPDPESAFHVPPSAVYSAVKPFGN